MVNLYGWALVKDLISASKMRGKALIIHVIMGNGEE